MFTFSHIIITKDPSRSKSCKCESMNAIYGRYWKLCNVSVCIVGSGVNQAKWFSWDKITLNCFSVKLLGKIRVNYNYPTMIRDATDEGSTALTIHAIFLSSLIHQFFSLLGSSRVFTLFLEIFFTRKKSRKMYMNCSFLSTNSWTSWTLFATSRILSLDLFSFRLLNNLCFCFLLNTLRQFYDL